MFRWLIAIFFVACLPAMGVQPLPGTHAHNDYEHTRPLMDALSHGFSSVEADIYLVTNALLVAHELKKVTPEKSLESLYLAPLESQIKMNGGTVYGTNFDFVLMIDIKGNGNATYAVLKQVLAKYQHILTHYAGSSVKRGPVTVVLSGSRPDASILAAEADRIVALDGKVAELSPEISKDLYPWVSENWTLFFKWKGEGQFPQEEKQKLTELVRKFHSEGRKVRFWNTPQNEAFWAAELACGVDYLNVDDLARAQQFLGKRLTTLIDSKH
jgi:glycerophosphoryl diester phosphodiesterase